MRLNLTPTTLNGVVWSLLPSRLSPLPCCPTPLAYAPDIAKPLGPSMGTVAALGLALSGFSNSTVALLAATCKISNF